MHTNSSPYIALAVLTLALPGHSTAQTTGQSLFQATSDPARLLARAADRDGSGAVQPAEWEALVGGIPSSDEGLLDRHAAVACVLIPLLDMDGGGLTERDLGLALTQLDADGSGSLQPDELGPSGASNFAGGSPAGLVGAAADSNDDGTVDASEWAALVGEGSPETEVAVERLAERLAVLETRVPEDRNAFTPATLVVTVAAGLDADRNGLLRLDDLELLHASLDTNQDRVLSAEELAATAAPQDSPRVPAADAPGSAPGEDPLMPWQRNLEDALALSRATGKPLLICVNMDGEAASESLAARRYRDPAFVELAEGFIPILASPDRHDARDYDGSGRRIPDSKFGRVVNGEHIDIEPQLFERYFQGQRVAPRHVGVSPEGEILFDLYLLQDLSVIDATLREHGAFDATLADPATLSEEELLASRDASARDRLEQLYAEGDASTRARLATLALDTERAAQHPALVRLALHDAFPAVRLRGVEELALHPHSAPEHLIDLYPRAFQLAAEDRELRQRLVSALSALAGTAAESQTMIRARRLARIYAALLDATPAIEPELWRIALAGSLARVPSGAASPVPAEVALATLEARAAETPNDPRLDTLFAAASLRAAQGLIEGGGGNPSFFLQDAAEAALRATERDAGDALAWSYLASASFLQSDFARAGDAATRALPELLGWADTPLAADVLNALAQSRTRDLYGRLGASSEWPANWVVDVAAAYRVLLDHPLGTEEQAKAGLDFLGTIEALDEQHRFLRQALRRYPGASAMHDYLRWIVLRDDGPEGLEEAYDAIEYPAEYEATVRWYGGLSRFIAAERHVEDRAPKAARRAYSRAIETFEESVELNPGFHDSAAHYIGLSWAGIARLELDAIPSSDPAAGLDRLETALEALERGVEANPAGLENTDGLGATPAATARELVARLRRADAEERAEELVALFAQHGTQL